MSEDRLKRTGEVFLIPFDKIIIDETINNGRLDFGDLNELANSIEENGLRVPIFVKKIRNEDRYTLIQGKRRMKAIKLLLDRGIDIQGIKCFVTAKNYSIETSLFDQIILNDGKPYSSLEQGVVFSQLVERGYSVQDIAKKTGKNNTHIATCIEMASLPKKVRDLVAAQAISGLTAVNLSKVVKTEEELIEQVETAVEHSPSSPDGTKKKVTNKSIKSLASASPLKKLEETKERLKAEGIKNHFTELFDRIVSRLKANEDVDSLMELFK